MSNICSISECGKLVVAKALCDTHYRQWRIRNIPGIKQRRNKASEAWKKRNPSMEYNRRYSKSRAYAKKISIDFHLSKSDYYELIKQPCYYCNGALNRSIYGVGLDRIDNERGYSKENVISACGDCNRTRGDRFTVEETKLMIDTVIKRRSSNE